MTQRTKDGLDVFFKNYLPSLIVLASVAFGYGQVLSKLDHNVEEDKKHHADPNLHMSFERKVDVFVTRREHEQHVTEMRQMMAEQDGRQRQILTQLEQIKSELRE